MLGDDPPVCPVPPLLAAQSLLLLQALFSPKRILLRVKKLSKIIILASLDQVFVLICRVSYNTRLYIAYFQSTPNKKKNKETQAGRTGQRDQWRKKREERRGKKSVQPRLAHNRAKTTTQKETKRNEMKGRA